VEEVLEKAKSANKTLEQDEKTNILPKLSYETGTVYV
jgi:hypothetical protein